MGENSGFEFQGIVKTQYRNSILKELFRKSIHLCSAFIPLFLRLWKDATLILLCAALVLYSFSEFLRLKGKTIPLVSRITEVAARKRDENRFVLGPVTLVAGILLASVFYEIKYATIGIFALAFGDGLASLFGKLFGRVHIPFTDGKTAAGSLTCFFAVYTSSFFVCRDVFSSLVLAFAAMAVEVVPMKDFDNVVIPVLIGAVAKVLLG